MNTRELQENILKTLLYYDIFDHPLKRDEIFIFLSQNTIPKTDILKAIDSYSSDRESTFGQRDGYVYVKPNYHFISKRLQKEKYSRKMWKAARFVTHIIKRFPFVRAVLVTGTLSKNSSVKESDLDFMVITAKDRLWISRTLLMLFKKIFLLNSYKYFCINYYVTEDNLEVEDKNIFTATEIAHIKATFNTGLMDKYIRSNMWIKDYFPNYTLCDPFLHSSGFKVNNRRSYLQKIFELFFAGSIGDRLNERFIRVTSDHWKHKYQDMDESERNRIFKTANSISTAFPGDMQKKILTEYSQKLKQFNLDNNDRHPAG